MITNIYIHKVWHYSWIWIRGYTTLREGVTLWTFWFFFGITWTFGYCFFPLFLCPFWWVGLKSPTWKKASYVGPPRRKNLLYYVSEYHIFFHLLLVTLSSCKNDVRTFHSIYCVNRKEYDTFIVLNFLSSMIEEKMETGFRSKMKKRKKSWITQRN